MYSLCFHLTKWQHYIRLWFADEQATTDLLNQCLNETGLLPFSIQINKRRTYTKNPSICQSGHTSVSLFFPLLPVCLYLDPSINDHPHIYTYKKSYITLCQTCKTTAYNRYKLNDSIWWMVATCTLIFTKPDKFWFRWRGQYGCSTAVSHGTRAPIQYKDVILPV